MDPCPFVRVLVGNLALKLPAASRPAGSQVHPSSTPCFCKISLLNFPDKIAPLPLQHSSTQSPLLPAASFHLTPPDIHRHGSNSNLKLAIYTARRGSTCGLTSGRFLGKLNIPIHLNINIDRPVVFFSGWINVGKSSKEGSAQLHIVVKSEPDPRFVFEFGCEPECNPQVFQIQGKVRQPVFTCRFSCRHTSSDRRLRSRSFEIGNRKNWMKMFGSESEKQAGRERKGWSITIHDLSGSPVAMASMVTPFVASPNTDRVSRSNPGAWLILCPEDHTWKPWGRLEAWRERGNDALGYRFEHLPDGVILAESAINGYKGGRFSIDLCGGSLGFVMSSTVGGEGRRRRGPVVEIGVQHVGCTEDAAAFVALAAAIDLSVDACRLFSDKLRKELQVQVVDGAELDGAAFL